MDEFKIGDRVFFIENHGLGVFGNVIKVDNDGTRLVVKADDFKLYEIRGSQVTNLEEQK